MGDSTQWYGRPDGDGESRAGGNRNRKRLRGALGVAAVCAMTAGGVVPGALADDGGGAPSVAGMAGLANPAAFTATGKAGEPASGTAQAAVAEAPEAGTAAGEPGSEPGPAPAEAAAVPAEAAAGV
ncbi:hypothetical protein D477_008783, partial [Arthrobacter crystallopoietes BAB-32]